VGTRLLVGTRASWGVSEVGLLTVILLSFENQTPILKDGHFVEEDGELTLVAPQGLGSEIVLANRTQGSTGDSNGYIRVRPALATLHRNGWLEVEQSVTETRIRLGKNARELRSPEQRKDG
jgi:hypothetical protein